jgi:hypothetical protein
MASAHRPPGTTVTDAACAATWAGQKYVVAHWRRADAIRAASPDATLTECLQAAFAAAEVAMTPQQRAKATQRVLVVAANSELQERGLLKHARIARSITVALRERGTDDLTARQPFPLHAAAALSDLQVRAAGLGSRSRLSA